MKVLYLGTDPSRFPRPNLIHFPLIQIKPLPLPENLPPFTHVILTSPSTIPLVHTHLHHKTLFAIGKGTAQTLLSYNLSPSAIASPETQEGMIQLLEAQNLEAPHLFYPRSSRARPLLAEYLNKKPWKSHICDVYETLFVHPPISVDFAHVAEIIFTSPSTVHAFAQLYGPVPPHIQCTCIGPVTEKALREETEKR